MLAVVVKKIKISHFDYREGVGGVAGGGGWYRGEMFLKVGQRPGVLSVIVMLLLLLFHLMLHLFNMYSLFFLCSLLSLPFF